MNSAIPLSPTYMGTIVRLNNASIHKYYLPYQDIEWDAPQNRIDLDDPAWSDEESVFIARTDWYRRQTQRVRNELGLRISVDAARLGVLFENILTRGLLQFSRQLPSGSAEYRYVMHEAIEECHHSMMFQEFINRSGVTPSPEDRRARLFGNFIARMAGFFPELFFMFVLGGETPIDHAQRESLRKSKSLPPLLRQIMQIHTTEEARHIHFAEYYLREHVPRLNWFRKTLLSLITPVVFSVMASMMMRISDSAARAFDIPADVMKQAYDENPDYHQMVKESFRSVIEMCQELGLTRGVSERLWRFLAT